MYVPAILPTITFQKNCNRSSEFYAHTNKDMYVHMHGC